MSHVEVGAARLHVRDLGKGPTVVLLHAGVADSRVWDWCLSGWLRAHRRVVSYDRRGFGESAWQPEAFSHVDDLLAVMDDRQIDRAVLIGSSQGGRIALDAALRVPDRVEGLALVGTAVTGAPFPFGTQPDPTEEALVAVADAAEEAGDIDGVNRFEARLWLDGPRQPEMRVQDPARRLFLRMNDRALRAEPVGEVRWGPSAWDRLGAVVPKTLVLTGRHDLTQVNEWSAAVAERVPDSVAWQMPRSAHLPMLYDPDTFVSVTLEFLEMVG